MLWLTVSCSLDCGEVSDPAPSDPIGGHSSIAMSTVEASLTLLIGAGDLVFAVPHIEPIANLLLQVLKMRNVSLSPHFWLSLNLMDEYIGGQRVERGVGSSYAKAQGSWTPRSPRQKVVPRPQHEPERSSTGLLRRLGNPLKVHYHITYSFSLAD